jgi:hypothetical protein
MRGCLLPGRQAVWQLHVCVMALVRQRQQQPQAERCCSTPCHVCDWLSAVATMLASCMCDRAWAAESTVTPSCDTMRARWCVHRCMLPWSWACCSACGLHQCGSRMAGHCWSQVAALRSLPAVSALGLTIGGWCGSGRGSGCMVCAFQAGTGWAASGVVVAAASKPVPGGVQRRVHTEWACSFVGCGGTTSRPAAACGLGWQPCGRHTAA